MRQEEEVGKIKNKNNNRVFSEYTPFIPSVTSKNPDCTLEYIIYHHY